MGESPEIELPHLLEDSHDRFGRRVAIATVLTTLLAALVAFLQANALGANDDATARSEQLANLGAKVGARWDQAAQLQLNRFGAEQEHQARAEYAAGQLYLGVGHDRTALRMEAARYRGLVRASRRDSVRLGRSIGREFQDLDRTSVAALPDAAELLEGDRERAGPCPAAPWADLRAPDAVSHNRLGEGADQDPTFPYRYLADSRRQTYVLTGLRDAANERSEAAERQFTRYAVALTMFAVAVFLFGYSLTPHGRAHRHHHASLAVLFVTVGSGWVIYTAAQGPRPIDDRAAAAYADGRVANERYDYRRAIAYYDCALRTRPTFRAAYIERASAYDAMAEQAPTPAAAHRARLHALADEEQAFRLRSDDPLLLTNLGDDLFVVSAPRNDRAGIERSLALSRAASERLPRDPAPQYNLARALLALGHPAEAGRAFAEATRRARHVPDFLRQGYMSSALGDLQELAALPIGARLYSAIRAAKEQVVAADVKAGDDDASAPAVHGLALQVSPTHAGFSIARPGSFGPDTAGASVEWYRRGSDGWTALPEISGVPGADFEPLAVDAAGRVTSRAGYLPFPRQCLTSGEYRVELYVNGRLAGAATQHVRVSDTTRGSFLDLNLGLCRPREWRNRPPLGRGLADAYLTDRGDAGVLAFDLSPAGARIGASAGRAIAVARRRFAALMPGRLRRDARGTQTPFLDLTGERAELFSYPGGRLALGAAIADDGQVIVGVVYGPRRMFRVPHGALLSPAEDVFSSFLQV